MSDLIRQQDVIDVIKACVQEDADVLEYEISILPPAEPKKGEWIINESYIKCSECEDMWGNDDKEMIKSFNFCPNCGADMRGKNNEYIN